MKLSIIIVNYNMTYHLKKCIESIYRFTEGMTFEIIIVDNNSTDGEVLNLVNGFPNLKILCRNNNKGFGAGCNYGVGYSIGKYILFINPDTVLIENSFKKMVDFMNSNNEIGIMGTLLMNENNKYQISYSKFPSLISVINDLTGLWKIRLTYISKSIKKIVASGFMESDWITGACMLVRRIVYEQTGGFDEIFFMYEEDVDFCYRIKMAGWKIGCYTRTCIIHNEGSGSKKNYYNYILMRHKSRIIYFKKHFSVTKLLISHFVSILILIPKAVVCLVLPKVDNRLLRFRGYMQSIVYYIMPAKLNLSASN